MNTEQSNYTKYATLMMRSFMDGRLPPEHDPDSSDGALGCAVQRQTISASKSVRYRASRERSARTRCTPLPENSSKLSMHASLPQVPDAIKVEWRADTVVRIRALTMYHSKRPNVVAAIKILSQDFPSRELLFFSSFGNMVATAAKARIQPARSVCARALLMSAMAISMSTRGSDDSYRGGCTKTAPAGPSDA